LSLHQPQTIFRRPGGPIKALILLLESQMSFSKIHTAIFAAALSLASTISVAQDVIGTITASLDGEERVWFLTMQDTESQTFGLTIAIANLQSFSLWGQPDAQSVQVFKDSLLLSFEVMSVANQVMPVNVSVIYLAEGWQSGWLADDAEKITFSLTTLEKTEEGVVVAGSFDAAANYSEPLAGGDVDASRTMQIIGTFTATLPPALLQDQ
jgi:hypothetical protein